MIAAPAAENARVWGSNPPRAAYQISIGGIQALNSFFNSLVTLMHGHELLAEGELDCLE